MYEPSDYHVHMKASLQNYKQSPQKTSLVAGLIRGKTVAQARRALAFLPKKSSPVFAKLLESAVANARAKGQSPDELVVKEITVNKGRVLRRLIPKARGRSARFARTSSIIAIELGTAHEAKDKSQKAIEKNSNARQPIA